MFTKVETEIDGKSISIETGKIAKQASGSVIVRCGDTMVLVTAVAAASARPDVDFLPLTIEYQEKMASVGRIPGNYFRREIGRPSEHEVLTCRIIDRPLRPLFPKGWRCETQVIGTVLSADQENIPDVLALTGASAALMLSNIPFHEPVAGGRVGYIDGRYVLNPTESEQKKSAMDMVVACTAKAIVMVEGKVDELSEDEVLGGIFYAFEQLQPLVAVQFELQKSNGKEKVVVEEPQIDSELLAKVEQIAAAGMEQVYTTADKQERGRVYDELKGKVLDELDPEGERAAEVSELLSSFKKSYMRKKTVDTEVRIGGRKFTEIRNIDCEVAVFFSVYPWRDAGSCLCNFR